MFPAGGQHHGTGLHPSERGWVWVAGTLASETMGGVAVSSVCAQKH